MKIHHVNRVSPVNPYQQQQEHSGVNKKGIRGKQRDEVQISTEAKELAAGTSVRSERVEELKQSVESGTYKVDAHLLADKILRYLKGE